MILCHHCWKRKNIDTGSTLVTLAGFSCKTSVTEPMSRHATIMKRATYLLTVMASIITTSTTTTAATTAAATTAAAAATTTGTYT